MSGPQIINSDLTVTGANINFPQLASGTTVNMAITSAGKLTSAAAGGSTILAGTITVPDSSWSGNTDYLYSITVTGAAIGDCVVCTLHQDLTTASNTITTLAWVATTDTVKVLVRVATYYTLGTNKFIYVKVIK